MNRTCPGYKPVNSIHIKNLNDMFGLFNNRRPVKKLAEFVLLQNSILLKLVNILKEMNERRPDKEEAGTAPEALCGRWCARDLGICLDICQTGGGCYARLTDTGGLPGNPGASYPVREYKGICYFILDSYAVFIEYDSRKNEIRLCGKISLLRKAADASFYPDIPFEFNPN
jgi:hypothetical protein